MIKRTVLPISVKIFLSSLLISILSFLSKFENGSSIRTNLGFLTKDLAKAILCFCPPDNSSIYLSNNPSTLRSEMISS